MDLHHLCVVGKNDDTSFWKKNDHLIIEFIQDASLLKQDCYDFVFISTSVSWLPDGTFDEKDLQRDVDFVRSQGYFHQIILTATLPIGVAGRLACHYLPIQQFLFSPLYNTPVFFGCYEHVLIDHDAIYLMVRVLFETKNISLYFTEAVEIIHLITLCQNYLNQSFYKEMLHFCFKHRIRVECTRIQPQCRDMTPILIYMTQQMEEAKLDCPILYSCLFRQHYIDISI